MLTRCHSCSDRLTRWTFAFYLVPNTNFRVDMISVYLANARAVQIKMKIEPSGATLDCPKMPMAGDPALITTGDPKLISEIKARN